MIHFSIITINYNNAVGLEKTIQSVIKQDYEYIEYIIIDGGSTDDSINVIKKYQSHISYWISEADKGIYNAMNKGIMQAHGDYLNFLNSSDCLHDATVLSKISKLLYADIAIGKFLRTDQSVPWGFPKKDVSFFDLYKGTFNHQTTFFKKNLFENTGYDESLKIVADWKFYLQKLIIEGHSFQNMDLTVVDYDVTGFAYSHPELSSKEREEVLKGLFPQRVLQDYEFFSVLDYDIIPFAQCYNKYKWLRILFLFMRRLKIIE